MQKRKKRQISKGILIAALILFSVSLSSILIYSFTLDYSVDEALFLASKSSNVTKLYYDEENSAKSLDGYVPKLYEELYGATRKEWCDYNEVSDKFKNAFLAMEDRRFFEHHGVDAKRTLAAFLNYFFKFSRSFGGSTITQQLIKNISGDNERSIKRKLNEVFRAFHIEKEHSKEEIFESYMNVVELGEGIVGVGEAAEYYFGKSAFELDYLDAATLVGMANAPTKYNPYKNPDLCLEKRNKVLYSLFECGYIDKSMYESLKCAKLSVLPREENASRVNSWFLETVIEDAARALSLKLDVSKNIARKLIKTGGYKIYTTVSPRIQEILESYFENADNFPKEIDYGLEFSMVVSDAASGNLLATVGGVGEKQGNMILNYSEVNITPGSTLKPIALYAPLLDAKEINWATVLDDVPVEFKKNSQGLLHAFPKNSPNVYDGLTTVKDALRLSKNTVAVRLFEMLGAESIYDNLCENFGFSLVKSEKTKSGAVLSDLSASPLALGQLTQGVSLRKLTESYNVFSNDGKLSCGRSFIAIFDGDGNLVLENEAKEEQVFSKETAEIMNKLLSLVVEDGTAKKITLSELVDTAGKTGTSGAGKDKVFIGYTPYFTAGIWSGYKGEKRAVSFTGKDHLEIWNDIAREIYNSYEIFEEERSFSSDGLLYLPYCKDSGCEFCENCTLDPRGERMEWGYFTQDNAPTGVCERHVIVKYDKLSEGIACEFCPEEQIIDIALVKVEGRSFPYEITVTDAEFVAKELEEDFEYPKSFSLPYFYEAIPNGEYVGKSKGRKQFNSPCYIHRN